MKHPMMEYEMLQDRQQQIRRDADRMRRTRLIQVYQPGLVGRLLANVGGWMIAQGTRLQARHAAAQARAKQEAATEIRFNLADR